MNKFNFMDMIILLLLSVVVIIVGSISLISINQIVLMCTGINFMELELSTGESILILGFAIMIWAAVTYLHKKGIINMNIKIDKEDYE